MDAKNRVAVFIGNLIMEVETLKDENTLLHKKVKELEEKLNEGGQV